MKTILMTGFETFGSDTINPSIEAVNSLPETLGDIRIIKAEIPTVRDTSLKKIIALIEEHHPDAVISVGMAGGRKGISVERIGINLDDYRIEDNAGNQPHDEPVVPGGPDGLFASIPVRRIADAMNEAGIEASVSCTAGTFVCNHVLYGTRHYILQKHLNIQSGFIHVPYMCEQLKDHPDAPTMALEDIVKGLCIAIQKTAEGL